MTLVAQVVAFEMIFLGVFVCTHRDARKKIFTGLLILKKFTRRSRLHSIQRAVSESRSKTKIKLESLVAVVLYK